MIGVILILVSWVLLRLEKRQLTALGFNAPLLRTKQFSLGLLVAGTVVAVQQIGTSTIAGVDWEINSEFDASHLFHGLRSNINSVLYEEFVFRGYLLYQAIRWLGPRKGVFLGAGVFGIYHWFSYGVFGSPVMMGFVFLLTGSFGFMLGLAFLKTKSIAAPIGLHLGWNTVSYLVFSGGPFGAGIFVPANGALEMETPGWTGLVLGLALPIAFVIGTSLYLLLASINDGEGTSRSKEPSRE